MRHGFYHEDFMGLFEIGIKGRRELLHNKLHELLFYHIEKYSLPFFGTSKTEIPKLKLPH
jgi:hypothetical protein